MATTFSTYADAMAVLKHPQLAQALYDASGAVMADALITLHGKAHAERRVVEFGVFGRGFFRHYEQVIFPATLTPIITPCISAGRADLVELGYRVTMNLTADFAGIDRAADDVAATETLLGLVKTFSAGATLVHSTRDTQAVNAEVERAMEQFDAEFLQPSIRRRQALLDAGADLPNDVLSVLLRDAKKLPLRPDVLRREMAFYLQAGAHSTANSMVHAMHEIFAWFDTFPAARERLLADPVLLQRCVHESLRLHPASPVAVRRAVAATEVSGMQLAEGEQVIVDLKSANRDRSVFGANADAFDPARELARNVWPFGLTFGYGTHACLGRDLDGGVAPKSGSDPARLQMGIVPLLVSTLLTHGAAPVLDDPPQIDKATVRANWGYYPVQFT